MALPSSGVPISMSMIRTELELGSVGNNNFRLSGSEMCQYTDLNNLSISNSFAGTTNDVPNIQTPNSMSEWYGYNHKYSKDLVDTLFFNDIIAPYGYPYGTFTTIDLGVLGEETYIDFTGSNFSNTGTAPETAVSYSLYYSTYSLNIPNSKLIKKGVLKSVDDKSSFVFTPNVNSGSKVTWIWNSGSVPASLDIVPTPIVYYDSFYNNATNYGTGGNTYNGVTSSGVTINNPGSNGSYYNVSIPNFITSSQDFTIGLSGSLTLHLMYQLANSGSNDGYYNPHVAAIAAAADYNYTTFSSGGVYIKHDEEELDILKATYNNGGYTSENPTTGIIINQDTWYSIIARYARVNNSPTLTIFVNGEIYGTENLVLSVEWNNWAGPIILGTLESTNDTNDLRIGFFRIWKVALSNQEVELEYNNFKNRY